MRMIATRAGVSLPTVELLFGTKGRLLKAAIDVAIVGDDEPVAVLDRSWAEAAVRADTAHRFLGVVADVLGSAQSDRRGSSWRRSRRRPPMASSPRSPGS